MLPGVCPGVCMTSAGRAARPIFGAVVCTCIGRRDLGCGNAEPAGLHLHRAQQFEVMLIEKHRRPGHFLKQGRSAHVVDMSMSDDDLAQGEAMLLQPGENLRKVVSRIDDDGFVGKLVAQDGAIAAQWTDRERLKDHVLILED